MKEISQIKTFKDPVISFPDMRKQNVAVEHPLLRLPNNCKPGAILRFYTKLKLVRIVLSTVVLCIVYLHQTVVCWSAGMVY